MSLKIKMTDERELISGLMDKDIVKSLYLED